MPNASAEAMLLAVTVGALAVIVGLPNASSVPMPTAPMPAGDTWNAPGSVVVPDRVLPAMSVVGTSELEAGPMPPRRTSLSESRTSAPVVAS